MSASASTKNESAADVAQVFLNEFARIGTEPLGATDVENRKTFMVGSFQRSLQSSVGFNATLAGAALRGVSPTEQLAYADRVRSVSGTAATSAIGRLLQPNRVSLIIVGDSSKFIDKLRALRPDVQVVAADKLDLATVALATAQ